MHERLKELRAKLEMNQKEFSKALGIGQSTLAMMEVNKRGLSERHIKTICAIFNVNEKWLRTGAGEMFVETDDSILASLAKEYDLDAGGVRLVEAYLNLQPAHRKVIYDFAMDIARNDPAFASSAEDTETGPEALLQDLLALQQERPLDKIEQNTMNALRAHLAQKEKTPSSNVG